MSAFKILTVSIPDDGSCHGTGGCVLSTLLLGPFVPSANNIASPCICANLVTLYVLRHCDGDFPLSTIFRIDS